MATFSLRQLLLMPCSLQPVKMWDSPRPHAGTTPTRTTSTTPPGLMTPAGLPSMLPGLLLRSMADILPLLWQPSKLFARPAIVPLALLKPS